MKTQPDIEEEDDDGYEDEDNEEENGNRVQGPDIIDLEENPQQQPPGLFFVN